MCGQTNHSCGEQNFASCIVYEGEVNHQSSLTDENCRDIEETTQDIYNQLENLQNELSLTDLTDCLDYEEQTVKSVLKTFEQEICNLKQQVGDLQNLSICTLSIEDCNLDFGTLVDQCGEIPKTLIETLQLLLNQHNT